MNTSQVRSSENILLHIQGKVCQESQIGLNEIRPQQVFISGDPHLTSRFCRFES